MEETKNRDLLGVVNTPLTFCIDWLTVVIPKEADYSLIMNLCTQLDWNWSEFGESKGGMNGYLYRVTKDDINILWGTPKNATPMGICISISGKGCRKLEIDDFNWVDFLNKLISLSCNFTRIDLAIDDTFGFLNISQMNWYLENGFATSKFRSFRYDKERSFKGKMLGEELKLGSRTSDIYIRFYDKKLEQNSKDSSSNIWNRYEIELKNNQAETAVSILIESGFDGATLSRKIFANYINFKSKHSNGKNKSRWKNTKWWDIFLDNCQSIKLATPKKNTNLIDKLQWLENISSSTLKMLYIALDKDKELLFSFLSDCIDKAELSKDKATMALECSEMEKELLINHITSTRKDVEKLLLNRKGF